MRFPLARWAAALLLTLIAGSASAITRGELYTWAAVAFPEYFSGTPAAGQYEQYDYRLYPSGNYLAVDDRGGVFVLGPVSGGSIQQVGTIEQFAPAVTAWQASQPESAYKVPVYIEVRKPDGSQGTVWDFVESTKYVINRWTMFGNSGVFPMGELPARPQAGTPVVLTNDNGVDRITTMVPKNERFYFTALWNAPVIGSVFMRSDALGAGHVGTDAPLRLELPYDFAVSEFAQAQRLAAGMALSPSTQALFTQAAAAVATARDAPDASARGAASYTALSLVMPLKEQLVLDASHAAIAAGGARNDFDMNYEGFASWTDNAHLQGYEVAKAAGFRSVLMYVDWAQVSPSDGTWDFSVLDYQIDRARALGFQVAISVNRNLAGEPPWVQALGFDALKARYREQARRVLERYVDKVAWFYVVSEFELEMRGLTMAQSGELAQASFEGARTGAPSAQSGIYVSAAAYAAYQMNPPPQPNFVSGIDWLAYLKRNGIAFDYVGLQMQYGTTFAPVDLHRFREIVQDVHRIVQVPIYMGETGYTSMSEDYGIAAPSAWHGGHTRQAQYEWAYGTLRVLYALPYVKGYYWVHLDPDNHDYGSDYLSTLVGTGFVTASGVVKKVMTAFRDFFVELGVLPP